MGTVKFRQKEAVEPPPAKWPWRQRKKVVDLVLSFHLSIVVAAFSSSFCLNQQKVSFISTFFQTGGSIACLRWEIKLYANFYSFQQ